MIKYFGTMYAGHIDMEGLGYDGTPANDRRYPNERLIEVFETTEQVAALLEKLGYDVFWMAEHHFQREGYECIPNLVQLGTHLAAKTERLKFGCAFNILPMWHPLRLAADYAVADILTNGRMIFGIGRGYHTREVETFGSPMLDTDANRELFEEEVEIILKAFEEESFSHKGKHYTIPPEVPYRGYQLEEITLVPRPIHRPVEVWQPLVSGSRRGIEFMVKHGIKGVISGTAEKLRDQIIHLYRDTAASAGQELALGENISLGFRFYIAETKEKAMKEARPYFEESVKFAAPLGMLRYSDEQLEAIGRPTGQHLARPPVIDDGVETKVWLCGPPEDFIDYLKVMQEKYPGVEHVVVSNVMGMPREVYKEQLTLFANEVMPAFRN